MVSPSIASATDRAPITWRSVVRLAALVLALLFLIVPHLCYRAIGRPPPIVLAFLNSAGSIAGPRVPTPATRRTRDVLFASTPVRRLDILPPRGTAPPALVSPAHVV